MTWWLQKKQNIQTLWDHNSEHDRGAQSQDPVHEIGICAALACNIHTVNTVREEENKIAKSLAIWHIGLDTSHTSVIYRNQRESSWYISYKFLWTWELKTSVILIKPVPRWHTIKTIICCFHYSILYDIIWYDIYIYIYDICHIILYYNILHYVILYNVISYYIILHYIALHYIISYYIVSYCITVYYIILYYIINIIYYITLHYITLYIIILYYIILY